MRPGPPTGLFLPEGTRHTLTQTMDYKIRSPAEIYRDMFMLDGGKAAECGYALPARGLVWVKGFGWPHAARKRARNAGELFKWNLMARHNFESTRADNECTFAMHFGRYANIVCGARLLQRCVYSGT